MEEEEEKGHVLAVPFQAEGHIQGLLRLAHAMAAMGLKVTFIYPARFHAIAFKRGGPDHLLLSKVAPGTARLQFEVADDGLPLEEECALTAELLLISIPIFQRAVKLILNRLTSQALPLLSCIVSDCVSPWTKELAHALALPHISFWTSTAASFSMSAHLPLLISSGHLPVNKDCWAEGKRWILEAPLVECIPGLPPFPVTDLPSEFAQAETLTDPCLQFLAAAFQCREGVTTSFLVHSVYELETQVFDELQTQGFAVEAVGPLLHHSLPQRTNHECLQWLDMQAASSVIYIALGTVSHLSPEEALALGRGLEALGCPFLWVMRRDEVLHSLPEAIRGSGIILPWVPQEEVLQHRAISSRIVDGIRR
ncbi:hypothetical protein L7F22_033500 [Adiantum nelumboides]|nr:hypothetical protein [Adiantum nelumboides]